MGRSCRLLPSSRAGTTPTNVEIVLPPSWVVGAVGREQSTEGVMCWAGVDGPDSLVA